jgi:hypothetical protein
MIKKKEEHTADFELYGLPTKVKGWLDATNDPQDQKKPPPKGRLRHQMIPVLIGQSYALIILIEYWFFNIRLNKPALA